VKIWTKLRGNSSINTLGSIQNGIHKIKRATQ
jgi:hypothetical protein